MARMIKKHKVKNLKSLREYVLNATYWDFPEIKGEDEDKAETAAALWPLYVSMLDTAIFGLIGDGDTDEVDIETALDAVLQSSLWTRRLEHKKEPFKNIVTAGLVGRAKYLWSETTATQRKAYFLAGVGLTTGQKLDLHADNLLQEMIAANGTIIEGDEDGAIAAVISIAKILFDIPPFMPKNIPENWMDIVAVWLRGEPISTLPNCNNPETLQFIEEALIYRLPWGMEAVRVRALAHKTEIGDGLTIDDLELGLAVPAIETGTLSVPAALLIKAGFNSRTAAIKLVGETGATFDTMGQLRAWLKRDPVKSLSEHDDWPTSETAPLWTEFIGSFQTERNKTWSISEATAQVTWYEKALEAGEAVRIISEGDEVFVTTPDYRVVGVLETKLVGVGTNLLTATVSDVPAELRLKSYGPIVL